ncbi:MAG: VWA domain-containing protein [Candidatus Nanohalobium sp.]
MRRKAQFSTFLKPIIILIFSSLLIALLAISLNFNLGLSEDKEEIRLQSQPTDTFQELANCLSTKTEDNGAYVLNQTLLAEMERKYRYREPECAENYRYGYEVEISQNFVTGLTPEKSETPADVVFALDDSGSMGTYLNRVKQNTKEFIKNLPTGSRVGMFTYASTCQSCTDWGLEKNRVNLTVDSSKVTSEISGITTDGGLEPEDKALKYAMNNFDFKKGRRKIIILLATESATRDTATSKHVTEWAQEAASRDITIYTVSEKSGTYKEIAETTGGKRFSVTADYSSIFEEIAGKEKRVGGDSTCTIPPVDGYNGSAQIVIAADTSENFTEEWSAICNSVNSTINKIESKGLKTNVSFYAPGLPGTPTDGQGTPMDINGASYDHRPAFRNVPSCLNLGSNNAVNGGITQWNSPGLVNYNRSKDYGYEAWGVFSKWILENHNWNQKVDRRMMFVVGNQDPTGGDGPADFRYNSTPVVIDGEAEIVEKVAEISDYKNVSIYTVAGDMEYKAEDRYGNVNKNDAVELMKNLSSETGGELIRYSAPAKISEKIREEFESLKTTSGSPATCENLRYHFGETHGSENTDRVASTFPVTIRHSQGLYTPGTLRLTLREGSLEKLAGAINQVTKAGRKMNRNTTTTVSLQNEKTLSIGDKAITRYSKTEYVLVSSGSTDIQVKDDLIIGVNGRKEFADRDGAPSIIDFSKPSNRITGYKGANIQLIAINTQHPELKLPELSLKCAPSATCTASQKLNSNTIKASQGDKEYQKLGGIGPFYHNFTRIKIGNHKTVNEKTVCYQGTNQCVVLRSNKVEETEIRPGDHSLIIRYNPSTGVSIE